MFEKTGSMRGVARGIPVVALLASTACAGTGGALTSGNADASPDTDVAEAPPTPNDGDAASSEASPSCAADLQSDAHNCGACGHDCLGGACVGGLCAATTVATGVGQAVSIAVDGTRLYWAEYLHERIVSADKDGANAVELASLPSASVVGPDVLALDADHVYWGNDGGFGNGTWAVSRCKKPACAGGAETLTTMSTNGAHVAGLAIGKDAWFWADRDADTVTRCRFGGACEPIVSSLFFPGALALDGSDLFFVAAPGGAESPLLARIAADAPAVAVGAPTSAAALRTLTSTDDTLGAGDLAVDATSVWYVDFGATPPGVYVVPRAGGTATPFAAMRGLEGNVVLDATNVYWSDVGTDHGPPGGPQSFPSGSISSCPKTGCGSSGPRVLAANQLDLQVGAKRGLAVDDAWVYFSTNERTGGAIARVAK